MTSINKKSVAIVIAEGFPLLSLSLVVEPLRIANRENPKLLFDWRILGADSEAPRSSSGRRFATDGLLDDGHADAVVLLASYEPDRMRSDTLMA
ncbi:MAG: hypothetical protein AAFO72_08775 [Pseudomonadota bacterium]